MKIFIIHEVSPQEQIGGSEIQCWLLAKYLSKKGHKISYLAIRGMRNKIKQPGEGFEVYYLSRKGDRKLKIFINFYKLLKKEKPDICYIRNFRHLFLLTLISKFFKIPVVFNTSHINNCKPDLEKIKFSLNPIKFLKSIRIVAQRHLNFSALNQVEVITINRYHVKLLGRKYNISAIPIYNSMEDNYQKNKTKKKKQIVWVNQIKARKKPEMFIKLVHEFKNSNYNFLMIGKIQTNKEHYKKLIKECQKENFNFKYLGERPLREVDKILAESQIMVNTCEPEGFGNNFIQAWFNKCPTITLSFDPDNIIEKNKIGFYSRTFGQMAKDVKALMNNEELRREMGERARKYALKNHSISANIKKYEDRFKQIINEKNFK